MWARTRGPLVLPGEAGWTPPGDGPGCEDGKISRLRSLALKHASAAIEMRPREAPSRATGVLPVGCGAQVHARCDVIETAASSSKNAAAMVLPAGQVYFRQPATDRKSVV